MVKRYVNDDIHPEDLRRPSMQEEDLFSDTEYSSLEKEEEKHDPGPTTRQDPDLSGEDPI